MKTGDPLTAIPPVTGHSRVVGVMAWPVTHSQSPPMHNAAYAAADMDLVYVPFSVAPDRVEEAVRGARALGMLGLNVTIPHKQAVLPVMDELSTEAAAIGAVNTIQIQEDGRLVGHNTDAFGFLKNLEEDAGVSVEGRRVVLAGAGGAGRAIAVGCALAGARSVAILNRTESRRAELCETLNRLEGTREDFAAVHADPVSGSARQAFGEADILVNATSLGMKPTDPTPVDPERLRAGMFVYDAVYTPPETRLLQEARDRGCRILGGLGMLAYQGARAVEIWTGRWPDADLMKRVLARNLGLV